MRQDVTVIQADREIPERGEKPDQPENVVYPASLVVKANVAQLDYPAHQDLQVYPENGDHQVLRE